MKKLLVLAMIVMLPVSLLWAADGVKNTELENGKYNEIRAIGPDHYTPFQGSHGLTTDISIVSFDFDDSLMPTGWTVVDGSSDGKTWDLNSNLVAGGCTQRSSSYWSGDWILVDSDCAGSGVTMDEELLTDYYDCSTNDNVHLAFDHYFNNLGASDSGYVEVRNGQAGAWTLVASYNADSSASEDFEITSYIGTGDSVQIRFHFWDNNTYAWYWGFDNFELYEYEAPTIDVAVLSIDSPAPPAYIMFPGTYTITATLANLMADPVTLDSIEFKVEDSTPAEVFRDVRTGDQIASYDTTQFSSTVDWTVSAEDWYTITVTAYVVGDGNVNDNAFAATRIVKTVRSYPWSEDFETVLLDASEWVIFYIGSSSGVYTTTSYYHSPTTSIYFSYSPYPRTAWLVSPPITLTTATDPMLEFFEACGYCGNDPDETHGAFFDTGLFDFAGWDTLAFYDSSHAITPREDYANAPAERFLVSDHIGDTVWVVFEFNAVDNGGNWYLDDISLKEKPLNDVGPTELVSGTMSEKNTTYTPVVEFTNFAGDTPTFQVRLIIDTNAVEIYNETDTIYTMDPFGTEEVTFPNFTPTESGIYNLTAISELPTVLLDADPSNDTLAATLTVYDGFEDFEADNGDLFGTNDWEWGEQTSSTYGPGGAYSGLNCWGTVLNGDVSDNTTSNLDFYLNVTADFTPPTPILDEGFENGGVIPSGWTDSPGTSPWLYDGGTDHGPGSPHGGSYAAFYNIYDYSSGTVDSLISPSMDFSSISTTIELSYWGWHSSGTDSVAIYLSEAGALTRLGKMPNASSWTKHSYQFTSTSNDAKIYFIGYSCYGSYNLYIDDVQVAEYVPPTIEFSFYQWYEGSTSSYYFRILADSGQGFEQLAEWQGSDTEWKKYTVEALVNYSNVVKMRLQCDNTSTYDYAGWYVDDFMLTGCEMWFPEDDIAAISIDEPTGFLMVDYGYDVKGTFSNVGTLSQTFDAIMIIEDTTTVPLAVVYADTVAVILAAGEDTTITFDTFTPLIESPYTFTMTVENPGDYDSGNNEVTATLDAYEHFAEGGPDDYGYRYIDNFASGGLILEDPPVFDYIDITATGDTSGTGSGNHGQFPIGFNFNFYGQDFDSVYINGYGYIEFGGYYSSSTNDCPMPNSSTPNEPLIAGFWDSGYPSSTYDGAVLYETFGTEPDRYMVIQYHNWRRSSTNLEWEIILHENGNIIFQYDDVDQVALYCAGQSAAVGMEDYNIPSGFSYLCNDDNPGNRLQDGLAIKWYFAPPSIDAALTSIDEPTEIVITPTTITPTVTVTNNSEYAYTIDVDFLIIDELGDTVYNQSETTAEIPGGSGQVQHLFSTTWDADTDGDYEAVAFVTLADDGNPANDTSSMDFTVATHYSEGGPDDFGYRFIDNVTDGGLLLEDPPVFDYIDITATGDTSGTGSGNHGQFPIGFTFNFYGQAFDSVYINGYGYLTFGGYTSTSTNDCPLPDASTPNNPLIAGFWDVGYPSSTYDGAVLYETFGTEPDRYMVIQYHNWRRESVNLEWEIILYEDGKILYQYLDINEAGLYGAGQSATVGLEDDAIPSGITYLCNDDNVANRLRDSLAIKWYYQPYIHNIATEQFLSPSGSGVAGDPIIPQVEFKNSGLVQETNVPVRLLIDPGAYDDPQTIASIDSAGTATVTFSQFIPTSTGSYTLTAIAELAGDENAVDDTLVFTYTVFAEIFDFEANDAGLISSGDWEWGTPTNGPGSAYSGVNCWATNLDGNYTAGLHTLEWQFSIGSTNPIFGFTHWYDTEARYDGGNFGISTDGGTVWTYISPTRGYDDSTRSANPLDPDSIFTGHDQMFWETVTFDLSAYAGMNVLARLAFGADGSVYYPGWYVDDFAFIDCGVYYPLDIMLVSIDEPTGALSGETALNTYDIKATVKNKSDSTLSFTLGAEDNYSYTGSASVTDLGPFESIQVTFSPGWTVQACSSYTLTAYTQYADDEDVSNDTLSANYEAIAPFNNFVKYDDGIANNAWRWIYPDWVIANQFDVPYSGASLSAIEFKFTNDDDYGDWPDSDQDSVRVCIFLDIGDGTPDTIPILCDTLVSAETGATIWSIGCDDTPITLTCESFWAGWALLDTIENLEGIVIDDGYDSGMCWHMQRLGDNDSIWVWQEGVPLSSPGDNMIRAYYSGDPATAPDISLADEQITSDTTYIGEADTASSSISNVGSGCDLDYTVSIVHQPSLLTAGYERPEPIAWVPTNDKFDATTEEVSCIDESGLEESKEKGEKTEKSINVPLDPVYPPITLGMGGPDAYGYFWIDSDEEDGPTYSWIDISSIGTEVTWDNGTVDDGWTNPITMGMTFNFYGVDYTNIVISTNGWTSFLTQTNSHLSNDPIPDEGDPNAVLAVLWDDQDGGSVGHCYYYYDATENQFIVSWVNWPWYPDPTDPHDFQVIINGDDGKILYQYGSGIYQEDVTVGIENEDGTIGTEVAYEAAYVHNDLALLFYLPTPWLSTDLADGSIAPAGTVPFNIFMDASELTEEGTYNGAIVISSNDPDEPVVQIDVEFIVIPSPGYDYVPGDINGDGDVMGNDVTYGVRYFKGLGDPPPDSFQLPDESWLYAAGDVNGSCTFSGTDITYLVMYFKGLHDPNCINWCADLPPLEFPPFVCPPEEPIIGNEGKAVINNINR